MFALLTIFILSLLVLSVFIISLHKETRFFNEYGKATGLVSFSIVAVLSGAGSLCALL